MICSRPFLFAAAFAVSLSVAQAQPVASSSLPSLANPAAALCVDGQCAPAISETTYFGRAAFRLTDGKTEAIVVPALGRVMRFGKVGGANWLWNSPTFAGLNWGWRNYGGDKTWLSPQSSWQEFHGATRWPPDAALDGAPHSAEVLSGGKLKLVSQTSPRIGIHLERTMWFNDAGEFVIEQTAVKTDGAPVRAGLWSISQSAPAESVFVPLLPVSPLENGFAWLEKAGPDAPIPTNSNGLLRVEPQPRGGGVKIGVDAARAAFASVKDGVAWVQRSAKPDGDYPDGVGGKGFSVEVFVTGNDKNFYVELELLGPIVNMVKGQKSTHTVKWSLHDLPSKNENDGPTQKAIAALLR